MFLFKTGKHRVFLDVDWFLVLLCFPICPFFGVLRGRQDTLMLMMHSQCLTMDDEMGGTPVSKKHDIICIRKYCSALGRCVERWRLSVLLWRLLPRRSCRDACSGPWSPERCAQRLPARAAQFLEWRLWRVREWRLCILDWQNESTKWVKDIIETWWDMVHVFVFPCLQGILHCGVSHYPEWGDPCLPGPQKSFDIDWKEPFVAWATLLSFFWSISNLSQLPSSSKMKTQA